MAFPPIYFKVEAGVERWDEMHVDGGVDNQVFLYGPMLDFMKDNLKRVTIWLKAVIIDRKYPPASYP